MSNSQEANPFPAITEPGLVRTGEAAERVVTFGAAEIDALETLSRVHGGHGVVHAVWAFVLSRYTRSSTVHFGSVRPQGVAPVLLRIEPDDTAADLVAGVADQLLAIDKQSSTTPSGAEPFDTLVVCESAVADRAGAAIVLTIDDGASPVARLAYDRSRLDDEAAADLAAAFCTALRAFARDSAARLHTIGLLEPSARRELVESTNPPRIAPCETTVVATFLDQAARQQAHTAVVCGDERVTYEDLAAQVEALARRLVAAGVGPGSVVGVFLERSPRLVVGLLAVMRAGGAFLPLDPILPDRRIAFAVRDSGARVLLTEDLLAARAAALVPPRRRMQVVNLSADAATDASDPVPMPHADDLAYVTYTSGSTGVPKGVAIDHRSLATNTRSVAQSYEIDSADVVVQFSSVNFDAALEQLLLPLTTGATLLLRGPDLWDPVELLGILRAEGATVLELTPQYGYELALSLSRDGSLAPDKLRLLILGGEAVATAELARWRRLAPGLRLVVGYGPTEVTITSSGWNYDPAQWAGEVAPLGRMLAHLHAYVVDEEMHPVPRRVPGEICIGGSGVARGYTGQPGLTAASFVPDPFMDLPGARMYRSGDIGAWGPDGNLVFLGRADEQVKIRGTRVEPGETAAALRRQTGVAAAEVLVIPGKDSREPSRLVGYVTPSDPAAPPEPEQLRAALAAELTAAAVPSSIVVLAALPLTANGKVDRAALPKPEPAPARAASSARSSEQSAAASELEGVLREVWAAVLGVPQVGPDDDFFALGGNSLAMLQVSARVKQVAGREIPLRQFFRNTTVASLARALEGASGAGGSGGDA